MICCWLCGHQQLESGGNLSQILHRLSVELLLAAATAKIKLPAFLLRDVHPMTYLYGHTAHRVGVTRFAHRTFIFPFASADLDNFCQYADGDLLRSHCADS